MNYKMADEEIKVSKTSMKGWKLPKGYEEREVQLCVRAIQEHDMRARPCSEGLRWADTLFSRQTWDRALSILQRGES